MKLSDSDRVPVIVDVVCDLYNMSPSHVYGRSRDRQVTAVRHLCWAVCRSLTGLTYSEIGRRVGGCEVSSVQGGVASIVAREPVAYRDAQIAALAEIGRTQRLMREALVSAR